MSKRFKAKPEAFASKARNVFKKSPRAFCRMQPEQQTIGKTVRKKKPERASGLGGLKQKTYLWT